MPDQRLDDYLFLQHYTPDFKQEERTYLIRRPPQNHFIRYLPVKIINATHTFVCPLAG